MAINIIRQGFNLIWTSAESHIVVKFLTCNTVEQPPTSLKEQHGLCTATSLLLLLGISPFTEADAPLLPSTVGLLRFGLSAPTDGVVGIGTGLGRATEAAV